MKLTHNLVPGTSMTASSSQVYSAAFWKSKSSSGNSFRPWRLEGKIHHFEPWRTSINIPRPSLLMWKPWNAPDVAQWPHRMPWMGIDASCLHIGSAKVLFQEARSDAKGSLPIVASLMGKDRASSIFPSFILEHFKTCRRFPCFRHESSITGWDWSF